MQLIKKLEKEVEYHLNEFRNAKTIEYQCQQNAKIVAYEKAINIIKQHSDWVSVGERLPDIGQRVLTQKGGYVTICSLYRRGQGKLRWDNGTRLSDLEQYTHWMPIPQPPSEVQND